MAELIPSPDLDLRNVEQIAAQAIARISDGATVELIDSYIGSLRALQEIVASGGLPPDPLCPELTNANYSSDHTALIEAFAWLLEQLAWRINQLPVRDMVEFHRLFGIELREATAATTTLQFTVTPPADTDVAIPAGTLASTQDGQFVFETLEELTIPYGDVTGDVAAQRTVAGATLLAPSTLTVLQDSIAYVSAVTNPTSVDSGSEAETVTQALARARSYQRRGERLVTVRDLEEAILYEALGGVGIVKAFDLVRAGDWETLRAGYVTVITMTPSGLPVSAEKKAAINSLLQQQVGHIFISLLDPVYHEFSVTASILTESLTTQLATVAAVKANLQRFYGVRAGNFGRPILRSDIIREIESTDGVVRIANDAEGPILTAPLADVELAPYELPKLVSTNLTVV
jgi:hypothetical protein